MAQPFITRSVPGSASNSGDVGIELVGLGKASREACDIEVQPTEEQEESKARLFLYRWLPLMPWVIIILSFAAPPSEPPCFCY